MKYLTKYIGYLPAVARAAFFSLLFLAAALHPAAAAPVPYDPDGETDVNLDETARPVDLGEIVVTGAAPGLAAMAPNHSVEILTRRDIEALSADTLPELLEYIAGADVRRRGPGGIQADVGLRGMGFERIAVLVNGVRVNDSQTGHLNMDIPVNTGDIERIEILRGQSAYLFGSGTMAGAINIVTSGAGNRRAEIEIAGGKFGLRKAGASYSGESGRMSVSRESSDGFRYDTDYGNTTFNFESARRGGGPGTKVFVGWNEKDFGANEFYAAGWPSREKTRTGYINLNYRDEEAGGSVLRADAYHRRHYDRFDCSVQNPALCANRHLTEKRGAEVERRFTARGGNGFMTAGLLAERDEINSSNIGVRSSGHFAAFARYDDSISERLRIDAGLRADRHTGYSTRWSWSAGAGYDIGSGVRLRANAGSSYRTPTFTELFYGDPVHVSFAGLAPETAFSYETGLDIAAGRADYELSFYRNEVTGLIDWTRADPSAPWRIGNTPEVRFSGITAGVKYRQSENISWSLSCDYLKISLGGPFQYKYTGEKPENAARAVFIWSLAEKSTLSIGATYEKMKRKKNTALADLQFRRRISGGEYYIRINNIFDRAYQDVAGVPMPGMTAAVGVKLNVITPGR